MADGGFMSSFETAAKDYLKLRRSVGYKLHRQGVIVDKYATFLDAIEAPVSTIETAMAFVYSDGTDHASCQPALRWIAIRGFARYLSGIEPLTQIPPAGGVSYRQKRRTPYVFTTSDVQRLMAVTPEVNRSPFRAATTKTMIGLLSVTGMRVGEAIGLHRDDVDLSAGVITIRFSKFGKSRHLPISPSSRDALASYAVERAIVHGPTTNFFVSLSGASLIYTNFRLTFQRAIQAAQVGSESPITPRIHDLRHTFAINTVTSWYRNGLDAAQLLPRLSTYLGHDGPRFTYWFLTATPELLGHATTRLENHQATSAVTE